MQDTTANIRGGATPSDQPSPRRTKHIGLLGSDAIALYINNSENPLVIDISQEAILGRFTPNSPSQPRVDLMPYGAYEKGVSRMHAVIRRSASGSLTIEDLLSNNGTFLNGVRLPPRVPYQLSSGNHIRLGQLEIEIYFGETGQAGAAPQEPKSAVSTASVPAVAEQSSEAGQSSAASAPTAPHGESTVPQEEVSTRVLPPESQVVIVSHYHGEVPIDPEHIFSQIGHVNEDIIRHFTSLIGYEIQIKLEIDVRGRQGFDEAVIRAIEEKAKSLKFTHSGFDDK